MRVTKANVQLLSDACERAEAAIGDLQDDLVSYLDGDAEERRDAREALDELSEIEGATLDLVAVLFGKRAVEQLRAIGGDA